MPRALQMLEWMEAGGSYGVLPPDAKVEVRNDLGICKCIRGVAATSDIELGETILEIPVRPVTTASLQQLASLISSGQSSD
jgi:hypothetical protein